MPNCPCCSDKLLRHARSSGVYWFCSSCWQEMPDFSAHVRELPRPATSGGVGQKPVKDAISVRTSR